MRPDDPLAAKEAISPRDLENKALILPRRSNVRNELANWFGNSLKKEQILFTSNFSTNSAIMVQGNLGYSLGIEGSVPFLDPTKIIYRPLAPELKANCVLAWKKQQPFSVATTKFIEHIQYSLSIGQL